MSYHVYQRNVDEDFQSLPSIVHRRHYRHRRCYTQSRTIWSYNEPHDAYSEETSPAKCKHNETVKNTYSCS